jgi:hypothetical protein
VAGARADERARQLDRAGGVAAGCVYLQLLDDLPNDSAAPGPGGLEKAKTIVVIQLPRE